MYIDFPRQLWGIVTHLDHLVQPADEQISH